MYVTRMIYDIKISRHKKTMLQQDETFYELYFFYSSLTFQVLPVSYFPLFLFFPTSNCSSILSQVLIPIEIHQGVTSTFQSSSDHAKPD